MPNRNASCRVPTARPRRWGGTLRTTRVSSAVKNSALPNPPAPRKATSAAYEGAPAVAKLDAATISAPMPTARRVPMRSANVPA